MCDCNKRLAALQLAFIAQKKRQRNCLPSATITYRIGFLRKARIQNMSNNGKQFRGVNALIFDLDGTLIDSKLDLALSMNATLEYLGRKAMDHDQIFSYVGNGVPVLIKRALG